MAPQLKLPKSLKVLHAACRVDRKIPACQYHLTENFEVAVCSRMNIANHTEWTDEQVRAFAKAVSDKRKQITYTNEDAARCIYTEYCRQVGGKAFNGDPLPDWDKFTADPAKSRQVNAWRAAASEVTLHFIFTDWAEPMLKGENYQDRVRDEKHALDEKISALTALTESSGAFQNLPMDERARLLDQQAAMLTYSSVLGDRIANFKS